MEGGQMTRVVHALRSGQITIPAAFRKRLGITEHSLLQMTLEGDGLRLTPIRMGEGETAGSQPWFQALYDTFAPVRAEAEERGYSEEEINAAIDEAVTAVRAKHG